MLKNIKNVIKLSYSRCFTLSLQRFQTELHSLVLMSYLADTHKSCKRKDVVKHDKSQIEKMQISNVPR